MNFRNRSIHNFIFDIVIMLNKFKYNYLLRRYNSPLIIGVCVGIAISIILTPFLQQKCIGVSSSLSDGMRLSNIRDLRSNPMSDNEEEDFEPNINLNENIEVNKKGGEDSHSSKLIRPRYYSTELGMKDKVLVAVISTKESIGTFGVAVNKTLNHYVDKLIFFLDGTGSRKFGLNIPIVGFKEYKPHIKIFRVLSYISEIYLEDYNYFMIVTDHTYVNGKKLMNILDHLSVSQNIHMGALQDDDRTLYCNLDSGIIISQNILQLVSKELLWCTKHSYSDLDSDNFGRCILHASNIPCKPSYQDQVFKSYSLQNNGWEVSSYPEKDALVNSALEEAVTVRNIKKQTDMSRLHVYYLQNFIIQTKDEISKLREGIEFTMKNSPLNVSYPWPTGSPNQLLPPTRHDVIFWETFNSTHIFLPNDFENLKPITGVDLFDIMSVVNSSVLFLQESSKSLKFKSLNYGYRRFDPLRGMDYLLSMTFDNGGGKLISKRVEAYRGMTQPEFLPMPYVTENGRVNILVFIQTTETSKALRFMERLQNEVKLEEVTISFCLLFNAGESYLSKDEPYKDLKDSLKSYTKKFYNSESRATFMHITVPAERPSDFALIDLAIKKLPNDSLVLVMDVEAVFEVDFINRVRMNTIKRWQVFSPIPFVLYHPDLVDDFKSYSKREIKTKNGHFDKYYLKIISFYIEDYMEARKLISTKVPIFRSEKNLKNDLKSYDLTVYGMFLTVMDLHVLRGIEPMLVMPYTPIECPSNPVEDFCEKRQSLSMGQRGILSKLVYEFQEMKGKL